MLKILLSYKFQMSYYLLFRLSYSLSCNLQLLSSELMRSKFLTVLLVQNILPSSKLQMSFCHLNCWIPKLLSFKFQMYNSPLSWWGPNVLLSSKFQKSYCPLSFKCPMLYSPLSSEYRTVIRNCISWARQTNFTRSRCVKYTSRWRVTWPPQQVCLNQFH